jgi:hypothetical protein
MEEKVEWFRYTWSIYIIKQLKIALNQEHAVLSGPHDQKGSLVSPDW